MRLAFALVLSLVAATGCKKAPPATPVVVLDGWWNEDYVKQACDYARRVQNQAVVQACAIDPVQQVRDFEAQLVTELASSATCKGIQFVQFSGPTDSSGKAGDKAMNGPHWFLMLNFTPGSKNQNWSMQRNPGHKSMTEGEGDAGEIARRVCAIANEKGAKFLD